MKGIASKNISVALLISLSYYFLWMLIIFISSVRHADLFYSMAGKFSWLITSITILNLLLHLVLIPFIRTQSTKWVWILLSVILLLLVIIVVPPYWNRLGGLFWAPLGRNATSFDVDYAIKSFFFQLAGLIYFAVVKFVIDFYKLKLANQQLIIEKNNAELYFLKSQTNPHFLFNTLNNIYLLTKDKSDMAPDAVLQLADILRYTLYETEDDLVPVDKEIKVIQNYLALEKIRYDDSLRLNLSVEIDREKQEIPPLLMIPLIENAFKHGVSETLLAPFIHICLTIQKETLLFTVENSTRPQETSGIIKENIGIRNLRRQLQLLFSEHTLTIEQRQQTFFASMSINLKSYAKN